MVDYTPSEATARHNNVARSPYEGHWEVRSELDSLESQHDKLRQKVKASRNPLTLSKKLEIISHDPCLELKSVLGKKLMNFAHGIFRRMEPGIPDTDTEELGENRLGVGLL